MTSGIFNVIRYWILNDVDKSPEEITDIIFAMAAKFVSG
ncbi:MAG: TetR family transcriptional regulator C-terminal domain-containing protein [Eggerthellaceae bacterium]|nr:TetR family transcriptional regulator C-terminal domain-containing protein [Eggerthellaceae bacterium]